MKKKQKTKDNGDVIATEQSFVFCMGSGGNLDQTAFANNSSVFTFDFCLQHQTGELHSMENMSQREYVGNPG